jgi:hypothetical protein
MTAGERLIQQGIQEGILVGERRILLRQVRVRFGDQVDAEIERRIETASAEHTASYSASVICGCLPS